MVGKFIVIDGLDGSGKGTQARLLVKRLKEEGYNVQLADFPRYEEWSSEFVKRYLRGEFGTAKEVGAKRASIFYAVDRYAASFQIKKWLEQGTIVISNRYVSASKGHQLGKIKDTEDRKSYLEWLNELEYGHFSIPKPELTLFLHMKPEIGQILVDKKAQREYTQGKKRDIHEADIDHLKDAEDAYLFCLENDSENWHRIVCFEEDQPKSIENIHQEVYNKVKEIIN